MDELVIKYYRHLLKNGFENAGKIENPSIYLDSVGENLRICGSSIQNFMHIYINIAGGKISEVKYLCTCDPTVNVAVEIMCALLKEKTVKEAGELTSESFTKVLGSKGEEFKKKSDGILELLRRGLTRYEASIS